MGIIEVLFIGIGLAMDAFAVSICRGLKMIKLNYTKTTIIAFMFGFFQALMPAIGYVVGKQFEDYIIQIDHWIAFFLLAFIGINMIKEAIQDEENDCCEEDKLDFKELIMMAIATSIDALAVGVTFAFLQVDLISSISLIGIVTFVICFAGVLIGYLFGSRFKSKAEIAGGMILILMGIKILFEHLGILVL